MKLTAKHLRHLIHESLVILMEDEREIVDLKPYGEWIEDLMNVLRVDDPDQIPDITSYDAYNHGVTPRRYADLIGEPTADNKSAKEMEAVRDQVSGDSEEDWIYDVEGEIESMMQDRESGDVVDIEDYMYEK